MKALTIIQPWATLIASGHKMNETRSWKTNYRGEVLIHAGKNPKDYTSGVYIDDPDGPYFHEAGITPNNFEELPRGSIIGKATLVNCIHINKEFRDHLKRSNPAEYAFGDYRIEHQCSYGSIMNLLEIWADGSIQGYLSAKQTLRIIERVKARGSPR